MFCLPFQWPRLLSVGNVSLWGLETKRASDVNRSYSAAAVAVEGVGGSQSAGAGQSELAAVDVLSD